MASAGHAVETAEWQEALARLDRLERKHESLRAAVGELEESAIVAEEKIALMDAVVQEEQQALANMERDKGNRLASEYLVMNQAAYAVLALPIGTILSVAPLYLRNDLGVPVRIVGYMLMAGELLGIVFMKYAELSASGFVLRRPNDLHLITLAVAGALVALPMWPSALWIGAAVSMIVVQAFNSASKPVIAEAVYRLSVLTRSEPSVVFAVANKWRRMGNAVVGASTPMLYMLNPTAPFYCSAPFLVVFTLAVLWVERKVVMEAERFELNRRSVVCPTKTPQGGQGKRGSAIGVIQGMTVQGLVKPGPMEPHGGQARRGSVVVLLEAVTGVAEGEGLHHWAQGSYLRFQLLLFAVVHAFPLMDAYISRLPFGFLTIAIADQSGSLWTACLVLFFYQSSRALGQWVQAWRIDNAVNYTLSAVAVVAYWVVLVAVLVDASVSWWCYPVVFTGLSETLAVQQLYLERLLACEGSSEEAGARRIRELVKASHTATGLGSAAAFLSSSLVYSAMGQVGVGALGVCVSATKLLLVVYIGSSLPSSSAADDTRLVEVIPAPTLAECPEPHLAGAAAVKPGIIGQRRR